MICFKCGKEEKGFVCKACFFSNDFEARKEAKISILKEILHKQKNEKVKITSQWIIKRTKEIELQQMW